MYEILTYLKKYFKETPVTIHIIRICIIGVILLPFVTFHEGLLISYYPWLFYKAIFFQALVVIMFMSWIVLALRDTSYITPLKTPIIFALIIFLGVLSFSQLFSVDRWMAFWGMQDHMLGVVMYWFLFAWFYIVLSTHKTMKDFQYIPVLFAVVMPLLAAITYFDWKEVGTNIRAIGVFGNPLHSSAAYLLIGFISLFGVWFYQNRQARMLCLLGTASAIFGIVLTGSRSTFWGLIFGCLIFALGALWHLTKASLIKYRKTFYIGVVFAFGVFIVTLFFLSSRFTSINHLFSAYSSDRIELWKIGVEALMEKPWFGWGIAQFTVAFDKNYNQIDYPHLASDTFSEAHNNYLDFAISGGIFTAIALISLWVIVLFYLFSKLIKSRNTQEYFLLLTLLSCFLAQLFQDFFFFYSFYQLVVLFLLLAFTTRYLVGNVQNGSFRIGKIKSSIIISGSSIFSIAIIVYVCIIPSLFEYYGSMYRFYAVNVKHSESYQSMQSALQFPSVYRSQGLVNFASTASAEALIYGYDAEYAKEIIHWFADGFRSEIQKHPNHAKIYVTGIQIIAHDRGSFVDGEIDGLLEDLKELSPNRYNNEPQTKMYASLALGDYSGVKEAIEELKQFEVPPYYAAQIAFYDAAVAASRGEYQESIIQAYNAYTAGYPVFTDTALIDALAIGTQGNANELPTNILEYINLFLTQTNAYLPHVYEKIWVVFRNIGEEENANSILAALESLDVQRALELTNSVIIE